MKCRKIVNILIVMLVPGLFPALGQDNFSLQELIRMTLLENYQLQIVQKDQQMAENLNTIGNAGFLPEAGIAAERSWEIMTSESHLYTGATRSGTNAQSTRFNALMEIGWTIFDGFAMFAHRDRLDHLAKMGELETRFFLEQTIADLAKTYYSLIREQRLLELHRQSFEVSSFRYELEERKRRVGSGNALLYHQAVLDLNADSARVIDQVMNIRDQQIQINRTINRNPDLPLNPENSNINLQGIPLPEEIIEMAISNNRDLERAKLEEMIADANFRIEKSERYPQVNLFGAYSFSHQTSQLGIIESAQNRGSYFGVRVRLKLFDGGKLNTRIENAMLEQEQAAIHEKDIRAMIESDLLRLTGRYHSFLQQHQLLQHSMEAANRSLIIAREQLQNGAINGYEFRQTQLTVLQMENQMIELMYAMRIIEIDIYRISGILLERVY
ncbi:MAG: TolC family protein [Bacteroidales bacterium]